MYDKPYSATLSFASLVIGLLLTTNASVKSNEFTFIGLLSAAGSLFLFFSVKENNIKLFNIGQFFIYAAFFVFYLLIVLKVPLLINVLFLLTLAMCHLSMCHIKKTEFLD